MNFILNFFKRKFIVYYFPIYFIFLLFFPTSQKAQVNQNTKSDDTQYKFRDNNRWEGVRSKDIKEVSSALELVSLIYYHEELSQQKTRKETNSMSIFFNSSVSENVMVSIFNLDEKYFMEPHPKNFNKPLWNKFEWPTTILNILKLKMKDLNGIATARLENKKVYFPIYFIPPEKINNKYFVLELSLCAGRGMLVDIIISTEGFDEPIKKWDDVKLIKYQLKTLHWNVDSNLYNTKNFRMIVTEKIEKETKTIKPEDEFNIYIAK
jgi:hypothetical protein